MGITHKGEGLEESIVKSIPWLEKNTGPTDLGDAVSHHVQMPGVYIEIKKNTWNQIRPWKYLVHVGFCKDQYFVVPPLDLVLKAQKKKGQHTINSMECMNLSPPTATNWASPYLVKEENLATAVLEAYTSSHHKEFLKYRTFAHNCRKQMLELTEKQKIICEGL